MSATWITAELAAAWLRVSRRTVHRWAKRDGWHVRGEGRTTEYLIDDVAETYRACREGRDAVDVVQSP